MQSKSITALYSKVFNLYFVMVSIILIVAGLSYVQERTPATNNSRQIKKASSNVIANLKGNSIEVAVKQGDTLASLLQDVGIKTTEVTSIMEQLQKVYDVHKLSIGQKISVLFDYENSSDAYIIKPQAISLNVGYESQVVVKRNYAGEFIAKLIPIKLNKYLVKAHGKINSSIMSTANDLGIPTEAMLELIKAYSYDVDFQRDIQAGDEIEVMYEKYYNEGNEHSHNGKVVFAALHLSDRKLELYRYTNLDGTSDYYNEKGASVRKELLRTPVNVTRISSGFGMRKHPVLGYSKMHKGIDFAAPRGTPIFAAGNGVIEELGRKGAYGNYIRIKHTNGYATAYAHISSFNKGLRKGQGVKQGDVIAYVGSTGRSTGPHLHYEVLVNNKHVNPLSVKLASNMRLNKNEYEGFKTFKNKIAKLSSKLDNQQEVVFLFDKSKKI
jgi:murein DD-endopeptidase MepM/ murein hydrolase activator NlpD